MFLYNKKINCYLFLNCIRQIYLKHYVSNQLLLQIYKQKQIVCLFKKTVQICFDIVFLDPPYNKNFVQNTLKCIENNDIINESGILTAEHHVKDILPHEIAGMKMVRTEKYGDTALSFYVKSQPGIESEAQACIFERT